MFIFVTCVMFRLVLLSSWYNSIDHYLMICVMVELEPKKFKTDSIFWTLIMHALNDITKLPSTKTRKKAI